MDPGGGRPVEGWRLSADFEAAGERCPRIFSARLDEFEPGRFLLTPAGFADEYVTLVGRTYEAVASWPDDVIPSDKPYVRLHFSPALPALD